MLARWFALTAFAIAGFTSTVANAQCVNCGGFAYCVPAGGNGYIRCRIGGEGEGTYCIATGYCSGARSALGTCATACKPGSESGSEKLVPDAGLVLQMAQMHPLAAHVAWQIGHDERTSPADLAHAEMVVQRLTPGQIIMWISQGVRPASKRSARVTITGVANESTFVMTIRDSEAASRAKEVELLYARNPGESDYRLRTWRTVE